MPVSVTSKRTSALVGRIGPARDAHDDLARVGELHRVAEQVHQDLAEPAAGRRDSVVGTSVVDDARRARVPFAGAALGDAASRRPRSSVADVEVVDLERQLARLDLGEVEDVVDDRQQRVGRSC